MNNHSFGKKEKLCSKIMIDDLFKNGTFIKAYPLKVMYKQMPDSDTTAKVLITVPKKRFGKAVSRNRLKRLIREAYRLNRPELLENWESQGKYFAIAFVYIGSELVDFRTLENVMKQALNKLKAV